MPIPEGWALNNEGQVETDPDVAYKASKLMPLGGNEINSGYKGYGLGMLVEIFCGILSGTLHYFLFFLIYIFRRKFLKSVPKTGIVSGLYE